MERTVLTLSSCPHDSAGQPERWFVFAQQLALATGFSFRFQLALDFAEFRGLFSALDLVYANPNDSIDLVQNRGFEPLARMEGIYDEAVIVCRAEHPALLEAVSERPVATCRNLIITDVALRYLERQGLQAQELVDQPSWGAALSALLQGKVDLAFLYRDFYRSLTPETKRKLVVLGETEERFAFHSFLVAPTQLERGEMIRAALLRLEETAGGRAALEALGCSKLIPVNRQEVLQFTGSPR